MDIFSSEHILLQEEDSDKLVIYFTDAAARNFAGYKILQPYKVNRLFIKDNTRNWYNGPIEGLSNDIFDLVESLKKYTSKFQPENIYCMGGSMGAYAAIVIGCLIGANNILAFSPQMMLDTRLPNNPKHEKLLKVKNVYDLLKNNTSLNISIFCGSEDLLDIYTCYPSMMYPNIKFICIYGAPHNTAGYLKKLGVLDNTISYFLNHKEVPDLVLPTLNFPKQNGWHEKLEYAIDSFYSNSIEKALNHFLQLVSLFPAWSPLYAFISECYIKLKQFSLALDYIERAININDGEDTFYLKKGVILINLKEYDTAEESFLKAKEVAEDPMPLHDIKIGSIKAIKGELDDAEKIFKKLYEKENTNIQLLYQLGLLSIKKSSHKEAINYFSKALNLGDKSPNTLKHYKTAVIKYSRESYVRKEYSVAEKILTDFLKYAPNDEQILKELSCNLIMTEKINDAINILKEL
ncbi:hypothetical protein V7152_19365 [Neobacillus drentensis]|uniref:tetratricopeptide repeat protein n=1 Tax=Neobacillus drentensis TaxID=220684 RepID=UPI002FFE63E5